MRRSLTAPFCPLAACKRYANHDQPKRVPGSFCGNCHRPFSGSCGHDAGENQDRICCLYTPAPRAPVVSRRSARLCSNSRHGMAGDRVLRRIYGPDSPRFLGGHQAEYRFSETTGRVQKRGHHRLPCYQGCRGIRGAQLPRGMYCRGGGRQLSQPEDKTANDSVTQNGVSVDASMFDWGAGEFPGFGAVWAECYGNWERASPPSVSITWDLSYAVRDASGGQRRIEVPRTRRGIGGSGERTDYFVINTIRNCNFLISVPVMKVHEQCGITASSKELRRCGASRGLRAGAGILECGSARSALA